jgi:bacillithiol biosynthesis deacetylase BshB1
VILNTEQPGCDLLVVSPHTDDAEIGLGGTIRLLADRGRTVWAVDLTRGELGTNATQDERWAEAGKASAVLGLTGRAQLDLPDGFIDGTDREQVGRLAGIIRRLRPRWLATAPDPIRHPDHKQTPVLAERAVFLARLEAWQPDDAPARLWAGGASFPERSTRWQVETLLGVCPDHSTPDLVFDVTRTWGAKEEALACYASQFTREPGRAATMINDSSFLEKIERRARTWGRQAGVEFGEALRTSAFPVLADLPDGRWSS